MIEVDLKLPLDHFFKEKEDRAKDRGKTWGEKTANKKNVNLFRKISYIS